MDPECHVVVVDLLRHLESHFPRGAYDRVKSIWDGVRPEVRSRPERKLVFHGGDHPHLRPVFHSRQRPSTPTPVSYSPRERYHILRDRRREGALRVSLPAPSPFGCVSTNLLPGEKSPTPTVMIIGTPFHFGGGWYILQLGWKGHHIRDTKILGLIQEVRLSFAKDCGSNSVEGGECFRKREKDTRNKYLRLRKDSYLVIFCTQSTHLLFCPTYTHAFLCIFELSVKLDCELSVYHYIIM